MGSNTTHTMGLFQSLNETLVAFANATDIKLDMLENTLDKTVKTQIGDLNTKLGWCATAELDCGEKVLLLRPPDPPPPPPSLSLYLSLLLLLLLHPARARAHTNTYTTARALLLLGVLRA